MAHERTRKWRRNNPEKNRIIQERSNNSEHHKIKSKEWRKKNKSKIVEYQKRWYQLRKGYMGPKRQELLIWYNIVRKTCFCLHCGLSGSTHWVCLDFHHSDPKNKIMSVSHMVNKCRKREDIVAEMRKCIVLCANCHRYTHGQEHNDNRH